MILAKCTNKQNKNMGTKIKFLLLSVLMSNILHSQSNENVNVLKKYALHKTKQILRKIYKFIIVLNIISFILMFSILIQFLYFNTFNYPRSSFFFLTCVYLPLIMIPIFIILIIFRINLKTSIIFLMVNVLIIYKAIEYLNAHLID